MERDANYIAVGTFVLLVLVMGGLFIYWYSGNAEHHTYQRYEIYFDGSVSGLTVGSPVRYLGVDVGRVVSMRIDPRSPNRVQIVADIDATTPISPRTLAQLSLQGITGLLYIDLLQGSLAPDSNVLAGVPSEQYPVIRSMHSDFDLFLRSLPVLTARMAELVQRASSILSDKNIAAIERITANLDRASAALPQSTEQLSALVRDLRQAVADAHQVITDVHDVTSDVKQNARDTVAELRRASEHLASATASLDAFMADNREPLTRFVRQGLPQLEGLLRDSRSAADEIRTLTRSLNDDPSRLIYRPAAAGIAIPP
jgi:phospholipid/cholesterol/gamma-HCH transport system substrate-binding protein